MLKLGVIPLSSIASIAARNIETGPFASLDDRAKILQSSLYSYILFQLIVSQLPDEFFFFNTGEYGFSWFHFEGSTGCPSI